jgi:hypothetical protein
VAIAYEKFIARAEPGDKDIEAARRYVTQHRPTPSPAKPKPR